MKTNTRFFCDVAIVAAGNGFCSEGFYMLQNAHDSSIVIFYYKNKQKFTNRAIYDSCMNEDAEILADNVTRLMKHHGDDQNSLARKAGVGQKTISNVINKRAKGAPNLDIVTKIAKTYRIKTWHLLLSNCPDEILFNHRVEKLVENFLTSDEMGRNATMAVSETRAQYGSEHTMTALERKPSAG